jgi:hypothetical protein
MLRKLLDLLTRGAQTGGDTHALLYYVKGHKCGVITRVRIDKRNDLSLDDEGRRFVRKVVVDSVCYGQVEVELAFDAQYREVERRISGGVFVDHDAWTAAQQPDLKSD